MTPFLIVTASKLRCAAIVGGDIPCELVTAHTCLPGGFKVPRHASKTSCGQLKLPLPSLSHHKPQDGVHGLHTTLHSTLQLTALYNPPIHGPLLWDGSFCTHVNQGYHPPGPFHNQARSRVGQF
jgi:hypothetical protein